MSISVMIASMGRPSLAETLDSVLAARVPGGQSREIVVTDDSPDGAVTRLLGSRYPDVQVVGVGAQNVSVARNACLDAATGDWMIFVDDDETVALDWLEGHLSAAEEFGADAVFGPVHRIYPDGTPQWFQDADPMSKDWGWSQNGKRVNHGRTGNTLIRRTALQRTGLRFDPVFGSTGGEDDDFFRRLHAAGAVMIVTDRANAYETVPEDRANTAYVLRRFLRFGQTYALVTLRGASLMRRAVFTLNALAKLAISATGYAMLRPFDRTRALKMQLAIASNRGKLMIVRGAPLASSWS